MMTCDKCGQESHVMTYTDKYPNLCDDCYYENMPDSESDRDVDSLSHRQMLV